MSKPTPEQPSALSPEDMARIQAEEAYRAQVRNGAKAAKGKSGCWGCLSVALAFLLIAGLAAQCSGSRSRPDSAPSTSAAADTQRISGDSWVGCAERETYEQLVSFAAQEDRAAFRNLLLSSNCTAFSDGEQVYYEDVPLLSGMVKVRRPGETQGYWTAIEAVD